MLWNFIRGLFAHKSEYVKTAAESATGSDHNSPVLGQPFDAIVLEPLSESILPGDVILLDWLSHNRASGIPSYFKYEYRIDVRKEIHLLEKKGYIGTDSAKDSIAVLRVSELQQILRTNGEKVSGKKDELIERIHKNLNESQYQDFIPKNTYHLTSSGNKIVEKYADLIWAHKHSDEYITVRNALRYPLEELKAKSTYESNFHGVVKSFSDDYFYYQQNQLSQLWAKKDLVQVEKIGKKAIKEGNWYPSVYQVMAMLYRKQKRYPEEAKVLKIGIERNQKNPGVAKRDFAKRLIRVQQLIESSKSR